MALSPTSLSHPQWSRRALFFGANALAALLIYFIVVEPLRALLAERAEGIVDRRATLARYAAVATQEKAVRLYAQQVAESNAQGELLSGATEGVVDANLQALLKAAADRSGATVNSIRMLPAKTVNGASLVGARLDVSGSIESLHALLRSLENETPLLLVLTASLRRQMPIWGAQSANDGMLAAQFDVFGGASPKERS
ncbi:general secretion pathway protein GspM [Methylosinus sp. R-45379]|jgi:hypothetical protein|uniref:type II secretion system protein GspM n=1 Tax=unclassified Methylosinus TaxID=2624500 RepID=UPI00047ADE5F|nr:MULTISPECIES: type II secretion system protein GspM [unclassified Methylosinus]OAI25730.1 general secretion pathway protein GspM [Methylosinus sp. R-45379]TDX62795.1 type II secretion system (T2SS) protein M subtype b [Methylosinus sp. sav-2]